METLTVSQTVTRSAYVRVRHSEKCPQRNKGSEFKNCTCRKTIFFYDASGSSKTPGGTLIPVGITIKESAKTRVWTEAEDKAQEWLDQFDLDKVRIKRLEDEKQRLETEKELQTISIEEAVARFLVFKRDNPNRRSTRRSGPTSDSTMEAYYILLGKVEPATLEVQREGHLFGWLKKQNPRPQLISDLTPTIVDGFRASWNSMSDLTAAHTFTRLKTFFNYCRDRGKWINDNPLDGVSRPSIQPGSRTAAFTDEQYQSILDTLDRRDEKIAATRTPETELETNKRLVDNNRLRALIELGRWGALAIEDAVNFKLTTLAGDAVRYTRAKSGKLAKPVLPNDVAELLRNVIPVNGDPNQPFRNIKVALDSDKHAWSKAVKELFAEAGIGKVTTEVRERDAHFHMLRDTFAVGQLEQNMRTGKPSLKSIADAMGDSVQVMLKHYAPVIDKLEKAHEEEQRKVVAVQRKRVPAEPAKPKVVGIGARRG